MKANRGVLFLIYLAPVVGWLVGLLFLRRQIVYLYHACQALALNLAVLVIPLLWFAGGWVALWVPLAGPVVAMASFGLVIGGAVTVVIAWLMGMANALRMRVEMVPFFGGWGDRIFYRLVDPETVGMAADEYTQQEMSET